MAPGGQGLRDGPGPAGAPSGRRTVPVAPILTTAVLLLAPALALGAPGLSGTPFVPAHTAPAAPTPSDDVTGANWSQFLANPEHTSYQSNTLGVNASNAANLTVLWSYSTGGVVVSEPTVDQNSVYFGSWNGKEYSVDANNGSLRWSTFTGQTACSNTSTLNGVTSTAALTNGMALLGGGGTYWYALSESNGSVLWKLYTGNNTPRVPGGGHYNWGSPLVLGKYAYYGLSSSCDHPLVQGQLWKIDLTSHRVVAVFNTTPGQQLGATIWASPAYDPVNGNVLVATGNLALGRGTNSTLDDSIIAVNASTLKMVGHWQVTYALRIPDGDFGASPTVFTDAHGHERVGDEDKDGWYFVLDPARLSAGPVWSLNVSSHISFSSAAFHGGSLYIGGATTVLANHTYGGSIRSVNATTGVVNWARGLNGGVIGPVTVAGGLVLVAAGPEFVVLRASDGAELYHYRVPYRFFGGPTFADGRVYLGNVNGVVYAFGLRLHLTIGATPTKGTRPLSVTFGVYPFGGGRGYSYRWTFGDGTTSKLQDPSHTYQKSGKFVATVKVTDQNGATVSASVTISVSERRRGLTTVRPVA